MTHQSHNPAVSDVQVDIARPADWRIYRDLRMAAINSTEVGVFRPKQVEKDRAKTDTEWQRDVFRDDMFVLLLRHGSKAVGMAVAKKTDREGVWYITSAYVLPEARGAGAGKKMAAARLLEIARREGKKVEYYIQHQNRIAVTIAESLGGRKVGTYKEWVQMETDLTDAAVLTLIRAAA